MQRLSGGGPRPAAPGRRRAAGGFEPVLPGFGGRRPDQEATEGEGSEHLQEPQDDLTAGAHSACMAALLNRRSRGYGAMAARLTPDQKVGSSDLSGLNFHWQLLGRVLSAAARPARPAALAPAEVRVPQLLLALQLCGSSPCIAA